MVCRNKDKAEEARADIVNQSGNTVSVVCPETRDKKLERVTNPTASGKKTIHLSVVGGVHPCRGHVRNSESLGVCGGL